MIRAQHPVTSLRPFERYRLADLGDVGLILVDAADTLAGLEDLFARLKQWGTRQLALGGSYLCTPAVLRGLAKGSARGPIHSDSRTDLFPAYFGGEALAHGNRFRVAVEQGRTDPQRMIQIGLRGTADDNADFDFAKASGIRIALIWEFFARGVADVMAEASEIARWNQTYVSHDIDFIGPAFAPGTGTPEVRSPDLVSGAGGRAGAAGADRRGRSGRGLSTR